ncbi:Os01g0124550, partial [Oryza sativa Japonica Group]
MWVIWVPDEAVISRAKVEAVELEEAQRGVHLRIEPFVQRPQLQRGDEGRAGASVDQADLHKVIGHHHDGLLITRAAEAEARDVHHGPEVDANVEMKHRQLVEAVVVAIQERGADEVLDPRRQRPGRVAVARTVGEGTQVVVPLRELRFDVLRRNVVVGAAVGEVVVGDVGYLGRVVHVARVRLDTTVYANE